jgi:hypothetical protein
MALPLDAQAAKDRMDKAKAALLADIENSTGNAQQGASNLSAN